MYQVDVTVACGNDVRKFENEFSGSMDECVKWASEIIGAVTDVDGIWFAVEDCYVHPVKEQ